ncbi:MAG: AMP-binding protein [Clostridia bacterium]
MELYEKFLTEQIDDLGHLVGVQFHAPNDFNFGFDVVDYYGKFEPNRRAMIWVADDGQDRVFSYADIMKLSNQTANYFKSLGIVKGDRVMLVLRRHWEFWPVIIALHKLGAIAIPATDQLKEKDFVYRFDTAGVKAIVCTATGTAILEAEKACKRCGEVTVKIVANGEADGWRNFTDEYKNFSDIYLRPTDGTAPLRDEIMLMYFTSGTTAYPKIAAHEHTYALAHFVTGKWWHSVDKDGVHFTVAETGWGKAVWGKLYGQWLCGGCVFTYDFQKFDQDKLLSMIEKYHITTFCAPPTIYRYMIKADLSKYNLTSLKHITTAGEALNPEVFNQLKAATGLSIMEGFGQTETTLTVGTLIGMTPKLGSMGKPSPAYKLRLVDSNGVDAQTGDAGEICIDISNGRPYGLFKEYYNNPVETANAMHDGLYHTGDMAWQDEDGYMFFVGRTDDIIKSSGYRIGPFEIESVLMEHPSVLECAVTGVPDPVRGQVVKATIVLANGYTATDELKLEIQQYVKKATAPYKYPRVIDFVADLPKTISGKIKRKELR